MGRALRGAVVLVSGAAGGLGAALCRELGRKGARVVALDVDQGKLDAFAAALVAEGIEAMAVAGDIADAGYADRAVARALDRFEQIDGEVNNAGISCRSLLADTEPQVIRRVMEVNFLGSASLTRAALPYILERRGFVVAVSSVAGFSPLTGRTAYAASKHALHGFFDSLRSEVEGAGVDVLLVCPSFIRTGIGSAALDGRGRPVESLRVTTGGESTPDEVAVQVVAAVADRQALLLPDTTSRKAWWLVRLAPRLYARMMKRRVGHEFPGLP